MQYDENAEKYGYEGEMTPLKCDKLEQVENPIEWGLYYDKSEVDEAIAELKAALNEAEEARYEAGADAADYYQENRKLKRALYNLRACYADMMQKRYIECKCDGWVHRVNKWIEVERRCLKKAEEY